MTPIPHSPKEWQTYANSYSLPKLPSKDFLSKEAYDFIQRDICVDVSAVLTSNLDWNFVYADVLAWPSTSRISVTLPDGGAISLYTRQFTSDTPVTLEISARSQDEAKLIVYASFLDQPISFTTPTATKITPLDLGAGAVIKLRTGPPASNLLHITTYRTLMGIASFPSCLLDSIASHRSSSGCPPVSLRLSRSMNMTSLWRPRPLPMHGYMLIHSIAIFASPSLILLMHLVRMLIHSYNTHCTKCTYFLT